MDGAKLDIDTEPSTADEVVTRRRLLGRGAKLAYVTPLIISAMSADSAFASVSGGGGVGTNSLSLSASRTITGGGDPPPDGSTEGYHAHNRRERRGPWSWPRRLRWWGWW
jgi:hypothetical protein